MSDTAGVLKVHKDELAGRYLTFMLGENTYGVELMKVIDIITIQAITSVPYVPEYVKGVINLRGKIIPVIDMRIKFGLPPVGYDDRTCIIVIEMDRIQVGMIVDTVSEVLTLNTESLTLIPEFDRYNNNKYLSSIGRVGEKLVMNLNCHKIFVEDSGQ
jgi:purine-binding chemotaxis protein CheW